MSESNYVALDFGAGSGRAILGMLSNDRLLLKEIHRFENRMIDKEGHIYWDYEYLFEELLNGLRKVAEYGNTNIKGIGIDTWGVDYGLIDENGVLLDNPFAYRDKRTNGIMDEVFKILPKENIYEQTGIQFLQFNTLYQLFSSVKSGDSIIEKADKLLFMPDLFNFMLTGKKYSEYTIASTSQMLNAENEDWDIKIFDMLDLPKRIMPKIIQPGKIIGKLLPKIKNKTKLEDVDVIAIGAHDTASAVAAVPAQLDNWAYLSSGTWSLVGIETSKPIINDKSFEYGFTNEGGVEGTNRFLKNTMGLWILEQCIKKWKEDDSSISYDELFYKAELEKSFQFIIDPDDPTFLNPPNMIIAIDNYCDRTDQARPNKHGEYVRCILESLAFKYRFIIDKITDLTSYPIEVLHIVGGGSQNKMLNQFSANALGVSVIAGPVEATAIGNILLQAIAKGDLQNLIDGRKVVKNSFETTEYIPQKRESWEIAYMKAKNYFLK